MYYLEQIFGLKRYSTRIFKRDLFAGLIVSLVALPLAMSFSISIGVKPEYGLYAAIVGGSLAAIFGGSDHNVTGPTGAFVAVLSGIVLKFGYDKLLVAGMLAGVILLVAGILNLGQMIHYVPYPVIVGFTTGIAIIIFVSQLGSIFGLAGLQRHEYFHENLIEFYNHFDSININALLVAVLTIFVMILLPRISPRIPYALIAIIAVSSIVYVVRLDVQTIRSVFGEIPNHLPALKIPEINLKIIKELLPSAFVIAALGSIESLLSCVVADSLTHKKHNSDKELIGQGIANLIVPICGGIPVTGAIARTAVNIKSGALTRLSSVFHALLLMGIVMMCASLVGHIPLAALGGVLVVVSYRMADLRDVVSLIRNADRQDALVMLVTLLLTVFVDLTVSIPVGLVMASLMFIKKMSEISIKPTVVEVDNKNEIHFVPRDEQIGCPHISIYTVEGALFFGATRRFTKMVQGSGRTRVIILRLKYVTAIDSSGLNALRDIILLHKKQYELYITGMKPDVYSFFRKAGLIDKLGSQYIFDDTQEAINQALIRMGFSDGCEAFKIIRR